jgi:CBS-domain-containing membrane protein
MLISDAMTKDVETISPHQSIREAAHLMTQLDIGALPVADGDRLVGMITDRDIAVRAVGEGRSPDTEVRDIMSKEVMYCFADEELDQVTHNMSDIKLRRLPVLDRRKRLVGIVSLGDIALVDGPSHAGSALRGISTPGGAHSQSEEARLRMQ